MSGPAVISAVTAAHLATVEGFFGIDHELNKHIFRYAAQADGRAFEAVIRAMAEAIQQDGRFGTTARIRQRIADEREKGRK